MALYANLAAIIFYVMAGVYAVTCFTRQQPIHRKSLFSLIGVALIFHGGGIYGLSAAYPGVQLGFFSVSSLIFWVINLIVLFSSLKKALHNLFILLSPLSVLAVGASIIGRDANVQISYQLASHVVLSILAYSLLTIATLQALLLAYQNHQLKSKHTIGKVRLLPPLQTMESLLFELLWAGEILLTLSILSGMWFLEDIFAQHLAHKTVFSIAAWVIYTLLLWGRHRLGWRGYTAIRWTLGGFALLMLAYFGSKLVLELILHRT
ncbi:MAG: cytochrome c biogenesis protein CcsA [Cellvibrio sp.]